ncbi:unnamed protein product [Durusdinium trenchii]|uniref:Uncharacterized protein n=1 Tax=Durusdinium trenchii TaxID=1381693 RepID=A0ABP0SG31_9DINO
MCTAMAPMQQRMQDLLEEVQGGFGFARLEELVKRPAETGSDAPESGRSSLGRALRLSREHQTAQEYERLVDLLCGPPVPYSASRGVRWRPPRRPRRLARPLHAAQAALPSEPKTSRSWEPEEPSSPGSPMVVHRHYHHHYHHHYAVSELDDLGHIVGEESCIDHAAPNASEFDCRAEIEHHHRHHHVKEAEMGVRARQLLEDALEVQRNQRPKPGPFDGRGPDPRLPRLT